MILPIFKNKALQKQFDEEGFVKVQLLNENDIEFLKEKFYKFHPNIESNSFGASSFMKSKEEKLNIRDTLFPIFLPHFEKIFNDYTYFGSSFLYKTPGKNSDLSPHQDWTIVDEEKYIAINIWTPLIDTNENNGTLYIVPKSQSQRLFSLRAPTLPFYFQNYFDTVIKCGIPTNAKAGEAIILNQSIIHYSSSNNSDTLRIAITSGLKSKDAPMIFHFKNKKKRN
ncbi:MAG: phytanoyl-CoA dioxygenase family protein [Saprospirales bacterium]|nr:phytanoyl-CoA dioxygenase family protein [Saprospirales bacterium]